MVVALLRDLRLDPLPALLAGDDPALAYFVRRDLLGEAVPPLETLWTVPAAQRLLRRQRPNGSWSYGGRVTFTGGNYDLLETYRTLRLLVEMYGLDRGHPSLGRAVEYVFCQQTPEGDIRGILANQYMPYYHGAILELLIKAGYTDDPRAVRGLDWLLAMRQDDGGWIIPAQVVPARQKVDRFWQGPPLAPDRTRPHAHLATGMALRALAAHPAYRGRPEMAVAARCLKTRLFHADRYSDRRAPAYWLKLQFPFWWTSLLTALDTLLRLGVAAADDDVARGLQWFATHQADDGLWETGYGCGKGAAGMRRWVGLAVCRVVREAGKQGKVRGPEELWGTQRNSGELGGTPGNVGGVGSGGYGDEDDQVNT